MLVAALSLTMKTREVMTPLFYQRKEAWKLIHSACQALSSHSQARILYCFDILMTPGLLSNACSGQLAPSIVSELVYSVLAELHLQRTLIKCCNGPLAIWHCECKMKSHQGTWEHSAKTEAGTVILELALEILSSTHQRISSCSIQSMCSN